MRAAWVLIIWLAPRFPPPNYATRFGESAGTEGSVPAPGGVLAAAQLLGPRGSLQLV
jgi:hypothetical protein